MQLAMAEAAEAAGAEEGFRLFYLPKLLLRGVAEGSSERPHQRNPLLLRWSRKFRQLMNLADLGEANGLETKASRS